MQIPTNTEQTEAIKKNWFNAHYQQEVQVFHLSDYCFLGRRWYCLLQVYIPAVIIFLSYGKHTKRAKHL